VDPKSVWHYKGLAFLYLKKRKDAISCFLESLKFSPNDPDIIICLKKALNIEASSALAAKNYEGASSLFDSIISLDSTDGGAIRNKALALNSQGELLYKMKQMDKAKLFFEKAIAADKNCLVAKENLKK